MHLMSQVLRLPWLQDPLSKPRFWMLTLYKRDSWRFRGGSQFLTVEQEGALGAEDDRKQSPTLSTKNNPFGMETRLRRTPFVVAPDTSFFQQIPSSCFPQAQLSQVEPPRKLALRWSIVCQMLIEINPHGREREGGDRRTAWAHPMNNSRARAACQSACVFEERKAAEVMRATCQVTLSPI